MLFPENIPVDNSQQTFRRKVFVGLAATGAFSGLLTMALLEFLSSFAALQESGFGLYVPGAVFAVIIAAYYTIFLRIRSAARWLGLFAASITANLIAFKVTTYIYSPFWSERERAFFFDGALFCGGVVGAFVLLGSAQLFFPTERKWAALLKNSWLWSLVGGALAVIGWELGGSLGKVLWLVLHLLRLPLSDTDVQEAIRNGGTNFCSLFVLWQAGMAAVLGLLISKTSAGQPERQSAASA